MKTHFLFFQPGHACIGLLLLLLGLGCDGCQDADIGITSVEITQGMQDSDMDLPLIANRATAVRVFLSIDTNAVIGPVTGVLTVTVDGQEITPAGGLLQLLPADARQNPDRNVETHTLNFELPAPTGITASSNVDFEVTIDYLKDTDPGNNTFSVDNLSFFEIENPQLLYTRLDYIPSGTGLPALSTVEAGVGDAMVKGIYPVVDSDPGLYEPAFPASFGFANDLNGNNLIDTLAETSTLLSTLDIFKDLLVIAGIHPLNYTYIYGWLNGSPMNGFGGAAPVGGSSGFGNTTLTQYQRSYAHELGHNFGMGHNSRTLAPDAGWDTGARLEGNPVTNNTTGRVKPGTLVDIMNSGPPTNGTWVDATSYLSTFNLMFLMTILPPVPFASTERVPVAAQNRKSIDAAGALLVQGFFNGEGTRLHLYPTLRLNGPARLKPAPEDGIFTAVVTLADGSRQRVPFDARVCYEGDESRIAHGYFELQIPLDPAAEVRTLEVYQTATRRKLGEWTASRPPSVEIVAPENGSSLNDQVTVRWQATDPDTQAENITYHLAYSPDAGKTWVAVAANLKGNSYTFPIRQLPSTPAGQGMLKLYACEGLNTVTATVGKLSGPVKP